MKIFVLGRGGEGNESFILELLNVFLRDTGTVCE
jgi:hypothetical protein